MKRTFRKPLILMMPKSLLRLPDSFSALEEFTNGSFQLVLDDPTQPSAQRVRRVLFCSGKMFYTLDAARRKQGVEDVALVRVEQLYPFPEKEIRGIFAKYRLASEVAWVQDEPENRGAWRFFDVRMRKIMPENLVLSYYGRDEAASPATGVHKLHLIEEQEILSHALELPARDVTPPPTPEERTMAATADKATPVSD
jgi:2-oxoglutarate dehydrogenase E1 component